MGLILASRAAAHVAARDNGRALADLDRALTYRPNDYPILNQRGLVYSAMRENGRALEDFTRAIQIDPSRSTAYRHRGFAHRREGHEESGSE